MDRLELEIEVDAGLSIAQLAERFGCSKGSIRYWLNKYRLKTLNRAKRDSTPQAIAARKAGLERFLGSCPKHGVAEFVARDGASFRCARCRVDAVSSRRRRVKQTLVLEAGGCCQICGYHRYQGALAFHHLDPRAKLRAIANQGSTVAIETLRVEARKCVLLCHNCHAEVEGGVTQVSLH